MTETFINSNSETHFSNNENYSFVSEDELISDRVHILANGVYQEFQMLIQKHGPGTVDGLMPLVVNILETMDKLYTCKDEMTIQLDLIREDQKELYTQYDRERTSRRLAEEKINRLEDQFEEENRLLEDRIELVESNNKLLEMRNRNCRDLICRMEEKEIEMKKEYSNLQMRYSDLLKYKVDHNNKLHSLNNQNANDDKVSGHRSPVLDKRFDKYGKVEIIDETKRADVIENDETDSALGEIELSRMESVNELCLKDEMESDMKPTEDFQYGSTFTYGRDLNLSMNEEPFLSFTGAVDNCVEDEDVSLAGEFNDLIMGKEIEFLIKENQDLVETKNALNVVKDDLINKLDEMTGEMCILHEDLRTAIKLKKEYQNYVQELERKISEIMECLKIKERRLAELGEDENIIEYSINENGIRTKTKFTRGEVAKILHERNKYKEELLELQETLRYQCSIMNRNIEKSKKGNIWNIFSNVLSNATAFTTEAFIGSGNEMTVSQLNRNFASKNKALCSVEDEYGMCIQLPNLSNNSPLKHNQKQTTPGSVIRISKPLLTHINDDKGSSSFDLVSIDSYVLQSSQQCDSSL